MAFAKITLNFYSQDQLSIDFEDGKTDQRTVQLANLFLYSSSLLKILSLTEDKNSILSFLESKDTPGKSLSLFDSIDGYRFEIVESLDKEIIATYAFSLEFSEDLTTASFNFRASPSDFNNMDSIDPLRLSTILMRYFAEKYRYLPGYLETFTLSNNMIRFQYDNNLKLGFEERVSKIIKFIDSNLSKSQSPNWQFKIAKQKEVDEIYENILAHSDDPSFKEFMVSSYKEITNSWKVDRAKFQFDLDNNQFPKSYTRKTYRKNMLVAEQCTVELLERLKKLFNKNFGESIESFIK